MKPFYSIAELAWLLEDDCFSVADGLIASGASLICNGKLADLSRWRRPGHTCGDGSLVVLTGTYPVPNPEHVVVASEALSGFWVESIRVAEMGMAGGSHARDAPQAGVGETPTGRDHVSDKLVKMNQASMKFWSNADRDDRGTHPDNATVAAWLVQQGFSSTLADKAATIIRPEWAPTGRKPEE